MNTNYFATTQLSGLIVGLRFFAPQKNLTQPTTATL